MAGKQKDEEMNDEEKGALIQHVVRSLVAPTAQSQVAQAPEPAPKQEQTPYNSFDQFIRKRQQEQGGRYKS